MKPDSISMTVRPTVYLKRSGTTFRQQFTVQIEAGVVIEGAVLAVDSAEHALVFDLGDLPAGLSRQTIELPEASRPLELRFTLKAGDSALIVQGLAWQPARRWTVYVNPSSHHDLGYTDLPSNVLRDHDRFLDEVIGFCEKTRDWPEDARYCYTIEQAWSVLHYLAHRSPEQVERLAEQMRAGRIEVTALFGNEISELCSSEEQVRLLYPAFRIQRQLGVPIRTAELNDIPGVSWGLASVLAGAGVRYFAPGIPDYFQWGIQRRFIWDETAVLHRKGPGAFWWQGPDGARVLFWYEGHGLGWSGMWTLEQVERDLSDGLEAIAARGYPFDLLRARVQGGSRDNSPPDLRFSCIVRDWNARWAYPHLVLSTSADFFMAFEQQAGSQLKTLRGDLPGTDYPLGATSTPAATAANRRAHDMLSSAERLASMAALAADLPYPASRLAEAYDQMLLFDEHTWGMAHPTGPAQEACWAQKAQFAYRAAALAQDVLSKSVNRLADRVAFPAKEYAVVVFNPLSQARTDVATVEAVPATPCGKPMRWQKGQPDEWLWGGAVDRHLVTLPASLLEQPFELVDLASGKRLPCQVRELEDPLRALPYAAARYGLGHTDPACVDLLNYDPAQAKELLFLAEDVPALGYKTYAFRLVEDAPGKIEAAPAELQTGPTWLENRFYRVELDPNSGAVISILDKELGRELVDPQATYGVHQVVGRSPRTGQAHTTGCLGIHCSETGPVCASLTVKGSAPGCPQVTQEIRLYAGLKRIDFATRILRDATPLLELFLAFPFQVERPDWLYEAPNAVQVPVADQLPGTNTSAYAVQHWVRVSNAGLAVDWTSLDAPVAAFGQLWSSPISQAHHGATPADFGAAFVRDAADLQPGHLFALLSVNNFRTNFQPSQAGDVLFRFSITSRAGGSAPNTARDFGWATSTPLEAANVCGPQAGPLPTATSFFQVDAPNIQLLTIKAAEDGDGLILRLAETGGVETCCRVDLPVLALEEAWLTDLVERNQAQLPCEAHSVQVTVPASSICTIRCRAEAARFPSAGEWWYE